MENNLDVTANFDMDLMGEFFKEMERQGPGDNNETLRALQFIPSLSGYGGCNYSRNGGSRLQGCCSFYVARALLDR